MTAHETLRRLLGDTTAHALAYLDGLPQRPVKAAASAQELHAALGGPLPDEPGDPHEFLRWFVDAVDPGIMPSGSGRYFGFVVGGTLPAALAADWLTAVWDQNAGAFVLGPAAAVTEDIATAWLADLLGLPGHVSAGFVTGTQMAHVTALAVARHHLLAREGWDVAARGLRAAPPLALVTGAARHVTIDRALRLLGLGTDSVVPVAVDDQGRMRLDALGDGLDRCDGPAIVCLQAGEVNTGAFDPLGPACDVAHERGAWVHVDGAFGLWAAASPATRHLTEGVERADSWATDAHKWLNVPYDSGIVLTAHPEAHRATFAPVAAYLMMDEGLGRDAANFSPEFSRRARGFAVYAALRSLGRRGVAGLVDRCCAHARRFADRLRAAPGVAVLNDVVLNQVLVRFLDPGGDHDRKTQAVLAAVQEDGTCWMSGTTWQGGAAMRISVSNWATTDDDVDRSVQAILDAAARG
jgi:glutamate/tyrosine decarboxylase-like PLP-dependent enzyme